MSRPVWWRNATGRTRSRRSGSSERASRRVRSEEVHHLLAAVVWVADEPTIGGIDHEVEQFERVLTHENREVVGEFHHLALAIPTLDGELDGAVNLDGNGASHRPA